MIVFMYACMHTCMHACHACMYSSNNYIIQCTVYLYIIFMHVSKSIHMFLYEYISRFACMFSIYV